jgi:putative intracellular protease/amidase
MFRKSILLILPQNDFNEKEFLAVKEKTKLANLNLFISSSKKEVCTGEKKLKIFPDVDLYNIRPSNFSALVLIGGKGSYELAEIDEILKIVKSFYDQKKLIAAICGAPYILAKAGILANKTISYHPSLHKKMENFFVFPANKKISICENILSAEDETASDDFASKIVEMLTRY